MGLTGLLAIDLIWSFKPSNVATIAVNSGGMAAFSTGGSGACTRSRERAVSVLTLVSSLLPPSIDGEL